MKLIFTITYFGIFTFILAFKGKLLFLLNIIWSNFLNLYTYFDFISAFFMGLVNLSYLRFLLPSFLEAVLEAVQAKKWLHFFKNQTIAIKPKLFFFPYDRFTASYNSNRIVFDCKVLHLVSGVGESNPLFLLLMAFIWNAYFLPSF